MDGWHYLLFELNGDGTETQLHSELPLKAPALTRALSTPHQITGTLQVPTADLIRADGTPLIQRRKSAIYAESPAGKIWVGGVVADYSIDGPVMSLDVAGFTYFPTGEPYDLEQEFVNTDPIDIVRFIWDYLQSSQGGNLGLAIDSTTSPIRVGTAGEDVAFDTNAGESVAFRAGPVQLNWWTTDDLGAKIDELAKSTPFDTLEEHSWGEGDEVAHFLRIGYPTIGNRLNGPNAPRFILGVNVTKMPSESYIGDDVVTGVRVFGAGEGRDRIVGEARVAPSKSLRRIKTITDKSITSAEQATQRAQEELSRYVDVIPGAGIAELVIQNKPIAPFGSYDVGDEVAYSGDHDWGEVDVWVKIVKLTISPATSDDVIATVVRTDTIRS